MTRSRKKKTPLPRNGAALAAKLRTTTSMLSRSEKRSHNREVRALARECESENHPKGTPTVEPWDCAWCGGVFCTTCDRTSGSDWCDSCYLGDEEES